MEKAKCQHFQICGLYAGLCILHSQDPDKDKQAFAHALAQHRKNKGDTFQWVVFPDKVNFNQATFSEQADFDGATFSDQADFSAATFSDQASFRTAKFSEQADFSAATFSNQADFSAATFSKQAIFIGATFSEWASFSEATFSNQADFSEVTFSEWASFSGATFSRQADFRAALFAGHIDFHRSSFLARTIFLQRTQEKQSIPVFRDAEVDFKDVNIDPPDALIFRDANLSKCLFQGTDLRQVELTGVSWPKIGKRFGVYDEIAPLETGVTTRSWEHIERIYRQLKQNYEDQRDYERAGDFHYGEKEMRRQNKKTPCGLKCLLTLYWLISGYGERCIRPLICAAVLLVASTFSYIALGIAPSQAASPLTLTNWTDWLRVALYSLQTMTLLKPTDLTPIGLAAASVKVFQSLAGPIIFGLFALAMRQRLKR